MTWAQRHFADLKSIYLLGTENTTMYFLSGVAVDPGKLSLADRVFQKITSLWGVVMATSKKSSKFLFNEIQSLVRGNGCSNKPMNADFRIIQSAIEFVTNSKWLR
ncbi:Hypothetical predicted protein [Pelobates cultripes]|uniref:Uncharacterized protein n=1 Tax=Pelobates cultripes TaxID=61616 RepID=A0AAD1S5P3_PELCU|nr:Hypothetical predicted protein [Pelobates cultripes]